jgi:hypothetical protein
VVLEVYNLLCNCDMDKVKTMLLNSFKDIFFKSVCTSV